MVEAKLEAILGELARLSTTVSELRKGQDELRKGQDELRDAFRENFRDLSGLYRAVRDDLQRFEVRVESKLSQVNQSIQALKDSIDRQDFRADELGRRIQRLEERPREPV